MSVLLISTGKIWTLLAFYNVYLAQTSCNLHAVQLALIGPDRSVSLRKADNIEPAIANTRMSQRPPKKTLTWKITGDRKN